jgi:hypothetical protein
MSGPDGDGERRTAVKAPRPEAPKAFWPQSLGALFDIAVKVAALFGAAYTYAEYNAHQRSEVVARTLAYESRFESAEFKASQDRIRAALVEALQNDPRRRDRAGSSSASLADPAWFAAYQSFRGKGVMSDLANITGFLNGLEVCIEAKLCDESISVKLFGPYAASLWTNFKPVIDDQRRRETPGFARETEAFVKRVKP